MRSWRKPSLYLIVLILFPLILMSPLLLTGKVMFWGTVSLQFVPWVVQAASTIEAGALPLWNPLVGMGAPLLANYQSALIYPPNWLVLASAALGGAGWAAWMLTWLVTLHLIWAGLGMFLLARRIGLSSLAGALCGLSFSLSGYLVSRSGFISINAAVSWMPWMLLAVTWLVTGKTTFVKVITTGMVSAMLLFIGHAQTAWYSILFSFAWAAIITWQTGHPHDVDSGGAAGTVYGYTLRLVLAKWAALAISLGLGVCLAAIQLLPTAELLFQSQRSTAVEFEYAMTYSFWPWRFLTLLVPGLFGSPVSGDYWGYGNYWEDALYIGVFPLFLAISVVIGRVLGLIRRKKKATDTPARENYPLNNGLEIFLICMMTISFLFALGKNTPVFPWLYFNIPTFAIFQAPTRFSIWAVISLILLAGIGLDRLTRPERRALYWTRLGTAGAGAITLGAGLAWYFLGDISPTFLRATALFGLFAVTAGMITLSAPRRTADGSHPNIKPSIWGWIILVILGFDLVVASWNLNPGIQREFYDAESQSASVLRGLAGNLRIYLSPGDEYDLKFNRFMRFDSFWIDEKWSNLRETLLPNVQILDGLASVSNFDPLVTARFARWMEMLAQLDNSSEPARLKRFLNLMGVGAVEYLSLDAALGIDYQTIENSSRVSWVPCAQIVRDEEQAWELLAGGQIDSERVVILENRTENPSSICSNDTQMASISLIDDRPTRIHMQVSALHSGWLVLSDQWYPGWTAQIDGQETSVYRANYLFKAVNVPAGEHQVAWIYRPLSFVVGLLISALSWVIIGIFWLSYLLRIWRNR